MDTEEDDRPTVLPYNFPPGKGSGNVLCVEDVKKIGILSIIYFFITYKINDIVKRKW